MYAMLNIETILKHLIIPAYYLLLGYASELNRPRPQKQLDTTLLYHNAAEFLRNGLAVNTRSTYIAGQRRYQNFCRAINATSILTSEQMLLLTPG